MTQTTKSDSGTSKGGGDFSSLLNFIPSAYYDLIARVCPGMAFWLAIAYAGKIAVGASDQTLWQWMNTLSGAMLFILIVLSYVSGIVLTCTSLIWDLLSFFILSSIPRLRDHLGLTRPSKGGFMDIWKAVSVHIDEVEKEDADAGRVLVKAMAEVTLCQNLLSALIILAIVGLLPGHQWSLPPADNAFLYWGTGVLLFLAMMFRQIMFLSRVKDLHILYATKPEQD